MLKVLMLRRSLDAKKDELAELERKDGDFITREAERETAINEVEPGNTEQEEAVNAEIEAYESEKAGHEAAKQQLSADIKGLEAEIEENVAARVNVLQEVSRVMAKELGREATVEELAAKMKMTEDEIRDIMKVTLDAVNVGTAMRMNLDGDGNEPESDPFGLEEP